MRNFREEIIPLTQKFFHLCKTYCKGITRVTIKLARQTVQLLKRLGHFSLQLATRIWRATISVTEKLDPLDIIDGFVHVGNIYARAFGRATIELTRQTIQLLKRLGHFSLQLATHIWRATVSATEKFVHVGNIYARAFGRATIKLTRQTIQLLKRLGHFSLRLATGTWHAVIDFFNWLLYLVRRIGHDCLYIFKTIVIAFLNFFRFVSVLIAKIVLACLHFIEAIIHAFTRIFHQISLLVKLICVYLWKKWLIAYERLYQYARLVRLNKPIGIFLLLWPTLWALWIASNGIPDALILLIFISGVVLMRSAGCAINDFVDRDLDTHVSRTRNRPIVIGSIKPGEALIVALVLILTAFTLVLLLNILTLKLSLVAIVLVIAYPFMKRFTYLPQLFLGLAFGWAIPMAFAAQTNTVPVIAWLLLMATVLWAVAYDTMYAMVDREDDIRAGIKSTAILFDDTDRVIIGVIQLMVLLTLIMIGFRLDMGMFYYASVAIAGILSIYQQFLIKDRLPENCLKAFTNNNWIGAAIFAGIYLNYQLI